MVTEYNIPNLWHGYEPKLAPILILSGLAFLNVYLVE